MLPELFHELEVASVSPHKIKIIPLSHSGPWDGCGVRKVLVRVLGLVRRFVLSFLRRLLSDNLSDDIDLPL